MVDFKGSTPLDVPPGIAWGLITRTEDVLPWPGVRLGFYHPPELLGDKLLDEPLGDELLGNEPPGDETRVRMYTDRIPGLCGLFVARVVEVSHPDHWLNAVVVGPCRFKGDFDVWVAPGETEQSSRLAIAGKFSGNLAVRLASYALPSCLPASMEKAGRMIEDHAPSTIELLS